MPDKLTTTIWDEKINPGNLTGLPYLYTAIHLID